MIFGEPAVSWPLDKCQLLHCHDGNGQPGQQDISAAQPQTSSSDAAQTSGDTTRQQTDTAAGPHDSGAPGSGSDASAISEGTPNISAARGSDASPNNNDATAPQSTISRTANHTEGSTDSQPGNREGPAKGDDAGRVGADGRASNVTAGERRLMQEPLRM